MGELAFVVERKVHLGPVFGADVVQPGFLTLHVVLPLHKFGSLSGAGRVLRPNETTLLKSRD